MAPSSEVNKFVHKATIFLIPFLILFIALEVYLSKIPHSFKFKKDNLELNKNLTETLIIGSSLGLHGIDPDVLGLNAFNLANGSQSLLIGLQLVEKLVPELPVLKRVVFTLGYINIDYRLCNSRESWRNEFYKKYFGIKGDCTDHSYFNALSWSHLALYGVNYSKDLVFSSAAQLKKMNAFRTNGFLPNEDKVNINESYVKETVLLHEESMRSEAGKAISENLIQVLNKFKGHPIQFYFVMMPVQKIYLDAIDRGRFSKFKNELKSLTAQFPHAHYLDYTSVASTSLSAADFVDTHHLNSQGAIRFSKILRQAL